MKKINFCCLAFFIIIFLSFTYGEKVESCEDSGKQIEITCHYPKQCQIVDTEFSEINSNLYSEAPYHNNIIIDCKIDGNYIKFIDIVYWPSVEKLIECPVNEAHIKILFQKWDKDFLQCDKPYQESWLKKLFE